MDKKTRVITNIVLTPEKTSTTNTFIITAPSAQFVGSFKENNLNLVFNNGSFYHKNHNEIFADFTSMQLNLSKFFSEKANKIFKLNDIKSKNILLIKEHLKKLKKSNSKPVLIREVEYTYHSKLARPLSSFPFVLFGALFGIRNNRKKGYLIGIIKSLLTILFTYFFIEMFRVGGQNQLYSMAFAAWTPYIILCFASICLYAIKCSTPLWEEKISIKFILKILFLK